MSTQNLNQREAREKYLELSRNIKTAMMLTELGNAPIHAIPMGSKEILDNGDVIFFSKSTSEHNANIEKNSQTQLIFSDVISKEFLSVYGTTLISKDKDLIKKHYDNLDANWFESKNDPTLTVLIFSPHEGHYWDNKTNALITLAKLAYTKATGDETEVGVSGSLNM
ncbi:MAG: general stress protein 26 [Flavobacteriaceae bacterium]|jgi:general stress protein 26